MKDEILNSVTMENILDKYGIEHKGKKYKCPFHGEDRHPSAAVYGTSFHCFACSKHLDVIGFVEEYFNLSFKEAMQKINMDFGLGLDNYNVDYNKLNHIKNIQNEKKKQKQKLTEKYCELCDDKLRYEKVVDLLNKKINVNNWETIIGLTSVYDTRLFQINQNLEEIDNKLSSRT